MAKRFTRSFTPPSAEQATCGNLPRFHVVCLDPKTGEPILLKLRPRANESVKGIVTARGYAFDPDLVQRMS